MPANQDHSRGAFCWTEVGTVDAARTKAFYAELFGWTFEDQPAGDIGTYTMIRSGGRDLGGLYKLPAELVKMGVPPHWMSYIAVDDADAACARIQEHGGEIQQAPMDVMDVGRMAIAKDPQGAVFSVWQAKEHCGANLEGAPGTPCWFELATKGVGDAQRFYSSVFDWKVSVDADEVYREVTAPGAKQPMGGMLELTPQHGPAPPHWLIYFMVSDCDAETQRAKELGAHVFVPPMSIPKVGRFSVVADPAGAPFALIKLDFDPQQGHATAAQDEVVPSKAPVAKTAAAKPTGAKATSKPAPAKTTKAAAKKPAPKATTAKKASTKKKAASKPKKK